MSKTTVKWLDANISGYEISTTIEGKQVVFVPKGFFDQAAKYFKRFNVRGEYRAHYTWMAFTL